VNLWRVIDVSAGSVASILSVLYYRNFHLEINFGEWNFKGIYAPVSFGERMWVREIYSVFICPVTLPFDFSLSDRRK